MSFLYPALRFVGHQHWIPRGRDRFIRLFAHPGRNLDFPFEVDFFGARYAGNLANFIDWTVYFYGALAHNELFLMRDLATHLRQGGQQAIGYDIGANVGQHTLYMSLNLDRVVAFEPFEAVRSKITEKLEANARTNVMVLPFALGDENGSFEFYPPEGENQGTGTMVETARSADAAGARSDAIHVETRRVDDLVRAGDVPVPGIVKIDVEGYEPRVLAGFRETLDQARPFILMEMLDDTRREVGDEAGLRALLYDDIDIFEVANPRGRFDYALKPFDFEGSFEILIAPRGAVADIPALRARMA